MLRLVLLLLWVTATSSFSSSTALWRRRPWSCSSLRQSEDSDIGVEYDADDARIVIDSILESTMLRIYGRSVSGETRNRIHWIDCCADAFVQYYELYGHTLVPQSYVFLNEASVREEHRGFALGEEVARIRQQYFQPHHKLRENDYHTLRKLGFEFKHSVAKFKLRYLELSLFRKREGHLNVRRDYVVPEDDPYWPLPHHGAKLGQVVKNIRDRNTFHEYRADLESLGLVYDAKLARVMLAIQTWQKLHSIPIDTLPYRWQVPSDGEKGHEQWPAELWGLKLGALLYRIKKKGALSKHREVLMEAGALSIIIPPDEMTE